MPMFGERVKRAWDAFLGRDPTVYKPETGPQSFGPPVPTLKYTTSATGLEARYNRIAIDVAMKSIRHVRCDENHQYMSDIEGTLNDCFTFSANTDQTPFEFFKSAVLYMLDTGFLVIIKSKTDENPDDVNWPHIEELRCGTITEWFETCVRIKIFNPHKQQYGEYIVPKSECCIVPNPFYQAMNAANSTGHRLTNKLALLDALDEKAGSPRLDLIFQLPYGISGTARRKQAEERRNELERQLVDSTYGIAYIDATEKFTQLNRPIENNIMSRVEYYTNQWDAQVGFKPSILDGTATEDERVSYDNNIVSVILTAIVQEMRRKFISPTARTQGQDIKYFKSPLSTMNPAKFIEQAERLVMMQAVSSNEVRQFLGLNPSSQSGADELRNPHLSKSDAEVEQDQAYDEESAQSEYDTEGGY